MDLKPKQPSCGKRVCVTLQESPCLRPLVPELLTEDALPSKHVSGRDGRENIVIRMKIYCYIVRIG